MGDKTPLPEELKPGSHFWRDHAGYEGEEARVVAHDPLNSKGWGRFLDEPELRYTRWLMPAAAFVLGGGRRESIDTAYFAAFLLFTGLGTYSLIRGYGWTGLIFVLLPATLIAMDRMTVNVSLAALGAAALAARRQRAEWLFWPAVALAPVAHAQGWVLPAAAFFAALRWKQWKRLGLALASSVPGIVLLKAAQHMAGQGRLPIDILADWLTPGAMFNSLVAYWNALAAPWTGGGVLILVMHSLDAATLVSLIAVAGWTVWRFQARSGRWERWAALFLVVPGALIDAEHHLAEPFMWLNHGTPLLLLHWADTPAHLRMLRWTPLLVCSIRVGYQFGFQVLGVLNGLLR